MDAGLLTDDLKKKRASNETFRLLGQPDVVIERIVDCDSGGNHRVAVQGFKHRDRQCDSGGANRIALWMLVPDYDGRSLFPCQVFFPVAGATECWARLARNRKAEIDTSLVDSYRVTISLPFEPRDHRRGAIKLLDDRMVESL